MKISMAFAAALTLAALAAAPAGLAEDDAGARPAASVCGTCETYAKQTAALAEARELLVDARAAAAEAGLDEAVEKIELAILKLGLCHTGAHAALDEHAGEAHPDAAKTAAPGCPWCAAEKKSSATTETDAANAFCPMKGLKVDPALVREFEGRKVLFCCRGCPEAWDKLSDEEKRTRLDRARAKEQEGAGETR